MQGLSARGTAILRTVHRFCSLNFSGLAARFRHGTGKNLPGIYQEVAQVKRLLTRFFADQSAATAIEYGLIAAGISLAIIAAVNGIGSTLNTSFTTLNTSLK